MSDPLVSFHCVGRPAQAVHHPKTPPLTDQPLPLTLHLVHTYIPLDTDEPEAAKEYIAWRDQLIKAMSIPKGYLCTGLQSSAESGNNSSTKTSSGAVRNERSKTTRR